MEAPRCRTGRLCQGKGDLAGMTNQETGDSRPIVLIVDDSRSIVDVVGRELQAAGFRIDVAYDGPTGLAKARVLHPNVLVLDILLPALSGLDICRQLRDDPATADIAIIMLTAKDEVDDRVRGLESGADDYLTKPFDSRELVARVQAQWRRQLRLMPGKRLLQFQDLTLDEATREVRRRGRLIELTATEYNLLLLFMQNPRRVLDRQTILDRVWGYDFGGETNIIEVYVRYLREKIEDDPSMPRLIHTVRGVGYVLKGDR
jgi:two-component system response regulator MprA